MKTETKMKRKRKRKGDEENGEEEEGVKEIKHDTQRRHKITR